MAELFFGRTRELNRFRKHVFQVDEGYGYCYSLNGPNGVGKTTLIGKLSEEWKAAAPAHTYYFDSTIEEKMTFWSFWLQRILEFKREIPEAKLSSAPKAQTPAGRETIRDILAAYDFAQSVLDDKLDLNFFPVQQEMLRHLNPLFDYYTDLGIRIILTIDEFDRAREVFPDGQFFQRLFDLTPKGRSTKLNLSIVTISRRNVSTIAHHMSHGSDFLDAFPAVSLRGFDNNELDEYFQSYQSLSCGIPDEGTQRQILYLCGRSPGMLMKLREELDLREEAHADVSAVYRDQGAFIKNAYHRMCTLMKTEYVDHRKTQPCMGVFAQRFLGPAYDENLSSKLETLYHHGFITQCSAADSIFVRAGLVEAGDPSTTTYEPLSPYFVEYVERFELPEDRDDIARRLQQTELAVRTLIRRVLQDHYDDWEERINQEAPKKDPYLEALRYQVWKNDANGEAITKLNVLSFNDYFRIIKKYWDIMAPYFAPFSDLEELKQACKTLNDSRNSSAHLNLEILNQDNLSALSRLCDTMMRGINRETVQSAKSVPIPSAPHAPASAPTSSGALPTQADIDRLVGKTVTMTALSATQRGSLRGEIQGEGFGLSISKKHLQARMTTARTLAEQDSISVTITRWDSNPASPVFNAELV